MPTLVERARAVAPFTPLLGAMGFLGWNVAGVWVGLEPNGDAVPALLLEVRSIAQALSAGDLGLWVHGGNLGHPAGIFSPLLPPLFAALLHMCSLDLLIAFKLAMLLPLVLLPLTTFVGVRALGIPVWRAAWAALAVATLTSANGWGVGPESVFGAGLFEESWAALFLPLASAWGACFVVDGKGPMRALAALLIALLCHPVVGACAALPIALAVLPAGRAGLHRALLLGGAAIVASAAQWLPPLTLLDAAGIFGPHLDNGDGGVGPARLLELLTGALLDHRRAPVLTILAALGVAGVTVRAARGSLDALTGVFACAVGAAAFLVVAPFLFWGLFPLGRAVSLLELCLCVLAGAGAMDALALIEANVSTRGPKLAARSALAVAGLSLVVIVGSSASRRLRVVAVTTDLQPRVARPQLDVLLSLARSREVPGRIAAVGNVPLEWRQLPAIYAGWAPLWTSRGPAVTSSPNAIFAVRDDVLRTTVATNTGLVIVGSKEPAARRPAGRQPLTSTGGYDIYWTDGAGWFAPVLVDELVPGDTAAFHARAESWWAGGGHRTGRHLAWRTGPTASGAGTVNITGERRAPSRFDADVLADTKGPRVLLLKVSWNPLWRVLIDDVEAPVLRLSPDMPAVELAPGAHRVSFVFRRPLWHLLLWLLVPAAPFAFGAWQRRRRRLTTAAGSTTGSTTTPAA